MQKTVNAKMVALKYKLAKAITNSLEKDKKAIKEGAKITFEKYCKIQVIECTKTSYSKEDKEKLDKLAEENCIAKQITHFKRVDIDDIPTEIDDKVNDILTTLEDSNDKDIKRVASKVANIK